MNNLFDVQYLDKTKELINRRINQILVTSYLYEVKNASTGISDCEWDKRAKELVKLIKDNREIAKELPYYRKHRKTPSFRAGDIRRDRCFGTP